MGLGKADNAKIKTLNSGKEVDRIQNFWSQSSKSVKIFDIDMKYLDF